MKIFAVSQIPLQEIQLLNSCMNTITSVS